MPVNKDFYTLAGSSGQSTGFEINQSARFNQGDGAYLQDPNSNAGDSRKKFTFSTWFKRGDFGDNIYFYSYRYDDNNLNNLYFDTNDKLNWIDKSGGSTQMNLITNRVFRDPSAWYHIVLQWDTAQAVSSERAKIYINGSRVTDFGTETYPSLNADSGGVNRTGSNMRVAALGSNAGITDFFDGYFAETHYSDNYSYGPEYFGEFDSNNNWIPKEVDISYGAASFYFDYATASNLGTNTKGKGNYSEATDQGAGLADHDQVLDTPTNNFNTLNPLYETTAVVLSEGNLEGIGSNSSYRRTVGTQAVVSGKWYYEGYIIKTTVNNPTFGWVLTAPEDWDNYNQPGTGAHEAAVMAAATGQTHVGKAYVNNTLSSSYTSTTAAGDIFGIAIDFDNLGFYIHKNGTYYNSGDPTSGSSKTGSLDASGLEANEYTPALGCQDSNSSAYLNFGQDGTFGGLTSAGGNSDSNGIGNFKYSVPSGYLALCSKNLYKAGG